jgi:hypothetical protein
VVLRKGKRSLLVFSSTIGIAPTIKDMDAVQRLDGSGSLALDARLGLSARGLRYSLPAC